MNRCPSRKGANKTLMYLNIFIVLKNYQLNRAEPGPLNCAKNSTLHHVGNAGYNYNCFLPFFTATSWITLGSPWRRPFLRDMSNFFHFYCKFMRHNGSMVALNYFTELLKIAFVILNQKLWRTINCKKLIMFIKAFPLVFDK